MGEDDDLIKDGGHMGEVTIACGMTEISPVSTQCATDDTVERRVPTVGEVLPHVEIKILDPEGRAVARGETGKFCTRGSPVMKGYWNDPDNIATAEEIRAFCKGQIAHYKIPRSIEFVPVFPMTITGKFQKFVMREQTISKLGLKAEKTA